MQSPTISPAPVSAQRRRPTRLAILVIGIAIAVIVILAALLGPLLASALSGSGGGASGKCAGCTPAHVSIAPPSATLAYGGHQVFTASAINQTGATITTEISFSWSLSATALGTLNTTSGPTVDFTAASANASGNLSVTATGNSVSVSASAPIVVNPTGTECGIVPGQTLNGAGSTLVAPLMIEWSLVYTASTVSYAVVGSGAGISEITAKTVDFAATDAPLNPAQRAAIPSPGVETFPESAGAVVPIYNLPGVSAHLHFTGQVLAAIYLGDITNWNDSALRAINPGVILPNAPILVVHRSDGSGTTFVWTSFLSVANATWRNDIGRSMVINWPVGSGAKGDSGVTTAVRETTDAIGYVALDYALTSSVAFGAVQNPAGDYILANVTNTESALVDSSVVFPSPTGDWYNVSVLNAPGAEDYPVATYTYILVYTDLGRAYGASFSEAHARALVDFLSWMVSPAAQSYSAALYYAPLSTYAMSYDATALSSITYNGASLEVCTP
ncbi:MAG TPA: phosphate ABC transporter substrate-binding protein PstS [Thermoplasmata archaeon]|nr:phosphate ABC transporter substrate-binding protein PstS [Thermoplasmata archaeon]